MAKQQAKRQIYDCRGHFVVCFRVLVLFWGPGKRGYDDEFIVSMEAADVLYGRVGLLLKAAEEVYDKQINSWKLAAERDAAFPLSIAFVNTLLPAS
ncbi:hypothetical protein [Filimonas effusa]|uniref:Uncharacterized protein n=1 Tax=Filimonas effusa TaxID=2508721 RepID=A0A4Q1CZ20_9BACT|nr:hypothetical protein [Filimonas effusa]RXK80594.1 hypothetical protein ESB13_23455 [Filimonas effusa]